MEIYQPAEDSYLLQKTIRKFLKTNLKNKKINKNILILDMGSGSGIQAKTCKQLGFENIKTADINLRAIRHLKKQNLNPIKSNLFSNLYNEKFDLIIFNPPYLPENKFDKKPDTTGGKKGHETIIKFLKQAKNHLMKKGIILLLFSSLSQPTIIKNKAKKMGYNLKLLDRQNLSFEELFIYKLTIN